MGRDEVGNVEFRIADLQFFSIIDQLKGVAFRGGFFFKENRKGKITKMKR